MSVKRTLMIVGLGIFGIIALITVFTSWYTVDESEQAVVITFGRADDTVTNPGLHFKLPWPVQSVEILSKETFSLQFGYKQNKAGELEAYDAETKMITGDENIVLTDLVVQWKITEPNKFLFNSQDPERILHSATSSAIRSIIGSSSIDAALTEGKADIEANTRQLLVSLIEKYDIGISVLGVKLQDVELPNKDVRAAFTAVTDAREMKNTKINEAEKYENQRINEAQGERDAIMSKAKGTKTARIEQAQGDVAVFNKMYEQYKGNQQITRERLILETLENVLPKAQIYIMNDDGSTMKYLPLQQLQPQQSQQTQTEKKEGSGN
ncbi:MULTISPECIES: FtsH protease activity modulator HflK [Lysinibacillus]|nr:MULTISPECIES: FtsH protease activity modulator HflK [Lysinibacillus]WHP41744.1 FtsH protease activity modulator HflK [Lysinibacillus boronitolerans]MBX8944500.1 FtsH protease activity modulator HflK [Lysinibacillus sp. K60]MCM0625421.1 FtsH protease activity modulator HflK [Lysinibacillus sp. OL1_EC]MCS5501000.1 FtsH protease activity modulator HflK [Lysinibacillus sp. A4]TBV87052.1 FtsH protease activity modulator HflK [Lysinibacillus sp. OL1]